MVLLLVDIDREDLDLYTGTKYSIIGPILYTIYGGCNNLSSIEYRSKTFFGL